jgi:subtilisin family serine protease
MTAIKDKEQEPGSLLQRIWRLVSRGWVLLTIAVVLLILAAVVWIAVEMTKEQLIVTCESGSEAQEFREPKRTFFLADSQVIVTGPRSDVDIIVADARKMVEEQDGRLLQVEVCDIAYRGPRDRVSKASPFPPKALRALRMALYHVDGPDVTSVLSQINDRSRELEVPVFADYNYLTGLLGQSACSSPNEPEISPYELVVSPNEPEVSPNEPEISPNECLGPADPGLFWNQWAFEHIGVGPALTEVLEETGIDPSGAGVRVGVFDTSPFTEPVMTGTDASGNLVQTAESASWLAQTGVSTTLHLSGTWPTLPTLEPYDPQETKDVRDHGLFVAGLIHAVAPESQINLVRVMNKYGCGDLFTLNKALYQFIAETEKERRTLDGIVLNLSLGVQKPRATDLSTWEAIKQGLEDEAAMETIDMIIDEATTVSVDGTLESLRAAVLLAHSRGAVVVAAAGNDSAYAGKPLSPHFPAAYPYVIGVSASNAERERACFSNWGDVAAPGGGGWGPNCKYEPQAETTDIEGESKVCDNVLISLSLASETGYAYWQGTSFSTPLVSGLAALVLDAGASDCICGPKWVHPDEVFGAIRCGAPTPDGVVSVPDTLFRCMP